MSSQGVTITLVDPAPGDLPWLGDAVRLHVATFSEGMLARLGGSFVEGYYRAIIQDPESRLWVAWDEGKVAGFLGGTASRLRFQRKHRIGAAKWRILLEMAKLRIPLSSIMRSLRKQRLTRDLGDCPELLTLAVSPAIRRKGTGVRLLNEWHRHLHAGGHQSYVVFTDNIEGFHFYTKNGGERLFCFELAGQTSAAFRMRIGQPSVP